MSAGTYNSKFQVKRIHPSIKKDTVNPSDYMKYDFRSACEDCSHFNSQQITCTLGYKTGPHLRAQQQLDYNLSGQIAQCRFLEIN